MNIQILKEFDLGLPLNQVRSVQLKIAKNEPEYILFGYSDSHNMDPWEEYIRPQTGNMHMALYGEKGQRLWHREWGPGVMPGVWFCPFIAFDLDQDGMEEIYMVHNTDDMRPFSVRNSVVEKIDPRNGKTMGTWEFPAINTMYEPMTHCYRPNLTAGYANGEPVLITSQGTYGDMFLQAYNSDMSKRWERVIGADEPGPRASHHINIFDFNNDGIDEVFWGERLLSIDNGQDVLLCSHDEFRGHSDIVQMFWGPDGKTYIYTCREDKDFVGCWRVVMYDDQGNIVWKKVQSKVTGYNTNHMHQGWVATVRPDHFKMALAVKIKPEASHIPDEVYVMDAMTGEEIPFEFPVPIYECLPVDINGDGYHEFYANGVIYDDQGNVLYRIGGSKVNLTKYFDYPGEQILAWYPGESKVRLWGDADAVDSEYFKKRYESGFFARMNRLTGAGYNTSPTVTASF